MSWEGTRLMPRQQMARRVALALHEGIILDRLAHHRWLSFPALGQMRSSTETMEYTRQPAPETLNLLNIDEGATCRAAGRKANEQDPRSNESYADCICHLGQKGLKKTQVFQPYPKAYCCGAICRARTCCPTDLRERRSNRAYHSGGSVPLC